jgi:hypothetical protein
MSEHKLGDFLTKMGCDNEKKVLRRRGWTFPPLHDCRKAWEVRFPNWKWRRNPFICDWQVEGVDDEPRKPSLLKPGQSKPDLDEILHRCGSGARDEIVVIREGTRDDDRI